MRMLSSACGPRGPHAYWSYTAMRPRQMTLAKHSRLVGQGRRSLSPHRTAETERREALDPLASIRRIAKDMEVIASHAFGVERSNLQDRTRGWRHPLGGGGLLGRRLWNSEEHRHQPEPPPFHSGLPALDERETAWRVSALLLAVPASALRGGPTRLSPPISKEYASARCAGLRAQSPWTAVVRPQDTNAAGERR